MESFAILLSSKFLLMHQVITSQNAPDPIGPYSQAVMAGNLLFISGQVALIPGTNELADNDIEQETEQVSLIKI